MKKLLLFIVLAITTSIGYSQAGDICFLHTATAANISAASSFIDHPAINNNPTAQIFVSHNLEGDGTVNRNDHVTGIWYSTGESKWAVYNEDLTTMIESASFNIYVAGTQCKVNTVTAPGGDYSILFDDPYLNNNPTGHPIVTHSYPPNNINNNHNVGFDYNSTDNKWWLYNEDFVNFDADATFLVLSEPAFLSFDSSIAFTHQATIANTVYTDGTAIDHPLLNNNPNAYFVVTHNYEAHPIGSDNTLGTWYSPSYNQWIIYNETGTASPMLENTSFSVVVPIPAPANDDPGGNIGVTVGAHGSTCTSPTYMTNVGATDSTGMAGLPAPSCGNYLGGDVFYFFTTPASGQVIISRTNDDWDFVSYSIHETTWANEVNCGHITNGTTDSAIITGLTPGSICGLRFWEWNNNSFGSEGFCVREHDPSASIAEAIIDGFSMYPNPVDNILNLTANNTIDTVSIYNMLGQEVLQSVPSATAVEIDMTSLSAGSYIVKVQAGEQIGSYNLIKE